MTWRLVLYRGLWRLYQVKALKPECVMYLAYDLYTATRDLRIPLESVGAHTSNLR